MRLTKKAEVPKVVLLQHCFQEKEDLPKGNTMFQKCSVYRNMLFLKVLAFKKSQKAVQDSSYLCLILRNSECCGCYSVLRCTVLPI